jgi:hypothetical protein
MTSFGTGGEGLIYGAQSGGDGATQSGQAPVAPGYGLPPQQPTDSEQAGYGHPAMPPQESMDEQPPYADQPSASAASRKRRTRRIILIVVSAVVVLGGGAGLYAATLGGGDGSSSGIGLNQAARDGKFEFVVQSIKCGIAREGDNLTGATAQGQFCEVHMTVMNIGNDTQAFSGDDEKAFDAAGREYSVNDDASRTADFSAHRRTFDLPQLNPGDTVTTVVIFDIPTGQTITKLELHDTPSSGGVTINVS